MNLKQNLLPIICLFSSFLGIALIYLAAISIQPKELKLNEVTSEFVGRTITASGKIIYKNSHPAGHIFLTISDGKAEIQVPLFAGFVDSLNAVDLSSEDFKKGERIIVTGLVGEYKGQLQIIPRKVEDIKILGDSRDL